MTRTLTRAGLPREMYTASISWGIATIAAFLLAPVFAFAAYNDVALTTDTVFSVNGITVNVSGTSAAVESIVVNSTDFTVTLASGSSIEMTAPNRNVFIVNTTTDRVTSVCTSSQSKIGYLATGALTLTVTPSDTSLCASASGSIGVSSSSGGGGGSSTVTTATTATTTATTTTATVTTTTSTTEQTSDTSDMIALEGQLEALQTQLTQLLGASTVFTRDLEVGGTGEDVRALQQFLNAQGFMIAESGPGSPGNETTTFGGLTRAALAAFQAANGITPSVGYFGPKTRAFVAGGTIGLSTPSMPTTGESSTASASLTRNLEVGSTGDDARALQQFLNEQGFMVAASGPGSPGNETTMFGGLTRTALAAFQAANGITPSVGYFGPKTRAFIAGM